MGLGPILFGFEGRIRRATFWLAHVGVAIALGLLWTAVTIVGIGAGTLAALGAGGSEALARVMAGGVIVWWLPLWLLGLWIALALGVKRCHDRGYPGVMILIAFVPLFGWLWALIDLGFIDGAPGPNAYGPSPKRIGGAATLPAS